MQNLALLGINTQEYLQTASNMIKASQLLFSLLQKKNLEAYKAPDLKSHIEMAVAQQTAQGFRIVKGKGMRHISKMDGAVALAIASVTAADSGGVDTSQPLKIESPFSDVSAWNEGELDEKSLPFPLRTN